MCAYLHAKIVGKVKRRLPNKQAHPERVRPTHISATASVDATPEASTDETPLVTPGLPAGPSSVPVASDVAGEATAEKEAKDAESLADDDFYNSEEYFQQQNFEYVAQYSTPLYLSPEVTEQKVKEQM